MYNVFKFAVYRPSLDQKYFRIFNVNIDTNR